jgi:hypothetical protein
MTESPTPPEKPTAKANTDQLIAELSAHVGALEEAVGERVRRADAVLDPVRRNLFTRYPAIPIILTTFGVVAVLYGFERLIMEYTWLYERPTIILLIGLATLTLTGTLYKKLG